MEGRRQRKQTYKDRECSYYLVFECPGLLATPRNVEESCVRQAAVQPKLVERRLYIPEIKLNTNTTILSINAFSMSLQSATFCCDTHK